VTYIEAVDTIDKHGFEDCKLVELMRSFAPESEILIVDDTTTALSLKGRNLLCTLMDEISADQRAVILLSHEVDEIIKHPTN
jgi:ribose transport system ATP-binding protein